MSDRRQGDGLLLGQVELIPEPEPLPLPDTYKPLASILERVIDDLGRLYEDLDKHYDDTGWVSYRFAEILPISPEEKQACLESDDPVERLESMRKVLDAIRL